jgi:phosphatidate cytidylyltransferase
MGSLLIALVAGMLWLDQGWAPWYPFQLAFQMAVALGASLELSHLFHPKPHQSFSLFAGVIALTGANWLLPAMGWEGRIFSVLVSIMAGMQLLIFLWEMATFAAPGQSVEGMARTWWGIGYLGLLPAFFAQIRWLYEPGSPLGTEALALAIFVPKGCDIGAYCTGRLLGKHPMAPILSPKKTWEGAIGGLVCACIVACGIDFATDNGVLGHSLLLGVGFGLTIGLAGMLGDLAESLIKRDCAKKDASAVVPGFGGVLDVVDAVIFAAPVAYFWYRILK